MSESIQTALIASLSAVMGGILAVAGNWLLHLQESKKALRQLHRSKLEDIADSIGESMSWYMAMSSARTFEELASCSQSSEVRRGYNLCCLYFPQLREPMGRYSDCLIEVYNFLIGVIQPHPTLNAGAQALMRPEYDPLLVRVRLLRDELESKLQDEAAKINKA